MKIVNFPNQSLEEVFMQRWVRIKIIGIGLLLIGLIVNMLSFSQDEVPPAHVLILNAYHFSYEWTFNQNVGISKTFENEYPNAILYHEFLDWKRLPDETLLDAQAKVFKNKYAHIPIDVIFTTDDMGLIFALKHRDELFNHAPIVFGGIIDHTARQIIGEEKNVTGVYEKMNPIGTLDLIYLLLPETKKIYLIHDLSESGINTANTFMKAWDIHPLRRQTVIEDLSEYTFDSLLLQTEQLETDSVIMLISYNISSDGFVSKPELFGQQLSKRTNVPIFTIDEFLLSNGVVGGSFLSGELHGEAMARQGISVINGTSADSIAHIDASTAYTAVDENQLIRFGLNKNLLTDDVVILNPHFSFYETYKSITLTALFILVLLICFIIILSINIQRRKRSEEEVTLQKMDLQSLNDQLAISEEELKAQNDSLLEYQLHLVHLAKHDTLTGLPNRFFLESYFENHLNDPTNDSEMFAFIFVDLDNFKYINNTYGHHFGDHVLKVVGERLLENNKGNMTCRIGGDEFILVHPIDSHETLEIEKYLTTLMVMIAMPICIGKESIKISASIGYSIYPDDGKDIDELIIQADLSMFNAKKQGKASFMHYSPPMSDSIENDHLLMTHLKAAYDAKEFTLHYQPQFNAATHQVVGFEALLRWYSKSYGYVPPSRLIPLAESSGLIIPIGWCIIEQAIQFALKMQSHLKNPFKVSVNISVVQLLEMQFVTDLEALLNRYDLSPSLLQLEITESVIIETHDLMINTLNAIQNLGIGISLDDFGTGYSSLTYLQKLPINEIKIDKSFVDEMLKNSKPAKLVEAMLYLAESLSLKVVAEGVETKAQQDYLLSKGCHIMQGYFNSKPLPMEEVLLYCEKYIENH